MKNIRWGVLLFSSLFICFSTSTALGDDKDPLILTFRMDELKEFDLNDFVFKYVLPFSNLGPTAVFHSKIAREIWEENHERISKKTLPCSQKKERQLGALKQDPVVLRLIQLFNENIILSLGYYSLEKKIIKTIADYIFGNTPHYLLPKEAASLENFELWIAYVPILTLLESGNTSVLFRLFRKINFTEELLRRSSKIQELKALVMEERALFYNEESRKKNTVSWKSDERLRKLTKKQKANCWEEILEEEMVQSVFRSLQNRIDNLPDDDRKNWMLEIIVGFCFDIMEQITSFDEKWRYAYLDKSRLQEITERTTILTEIVSMLEDDNNAAKARKHKKRFKVVYENLRDF